MSFCKLITHCWDFKICPHKIAQVVLSHPYVFGFYERPTKNCIPLTLAPLQYDNFQQSTREFAGKYVLQLFGRKQNTFLHISCLKQIRYEWYEYVCTFRKYLHIKGRQIRKALFVGEDLALPSHTSESKQNLAN